MCYTKFDLDWKGSISEKTVIDALKRINDYFECFRGVFNVDELFEDRMKWYSHAEDMLELSREFPDVLFILTGVGEEFPDFWKEYYKNGKTQHCHGIVSYGMFNPEIFR